MLTQLYFYPRPPGGGRPHFCFCNCFFGFYFYPRPPGGGRLVVETVFKSGAPISIHALRVEGDFKHTVPENIGYGISIHALRVEGDAFRVKRNIVKVRFLSTPSGWRATVPVCTINTNIFAFLSTPSGWRATPFDNIKHTAVGISIHALRVEGDGARGNARGGESISIHALRVEGDLADTLESIDDEFISIHALRVEGDSKNRQSFHLFLRKREKNLPL